MAANYDNSAWFYDKLARLVYGNALVNAQVYLLQFIKPDSSILIVGGGTGWILEEIAKLYQSGLEITYVEVSAKMTALSQKRNYGNNNVAFLNMPIEKTEGLSQFDVVITPFLFDNFTKQTQKTVFDHLHTLIKRDGLWLNCDFQLTGKWWQAALLNTMLIFFKISCGIEADKLIDVKPNFVNNGYNVIAGKSFFGDFVTANVYQECIETYEVS